METKQIAIIGTAALGIGVVVFMVYKNSAAKPQKKDNIMATSDIIELPSDIKAIVAPKDVQPSHSSPPRTISAPMQQQAQLLPQSIDPMNKKLQYFPFGTSKAVSEVKIMQAFLNSVDKEKKFKPLKINGKFENATMKRLKAYMKGIPFSEKFITLHILREVDETPTLMGLHLFGL